MNSNEIRKKFLEYFEEKGHKIVPSAPIVVKDDPTLMFINAGMNPFKDFFTGAKRPEYTRIADTQKCLRVSGKHNDLEEVGVDTYHHTMFEMLGNWSFGDYFKEEAIEWAWELLTEVYKLPKDRLYVTIFEGDDSQDLAKDTESHNIWTKYIDEDRILLGNKKDNFWEMGDTGPCGPCSEIHFDNRNDEERQKVDGATLVNEDHPQVIEIWNLVFMQFNRKKDGTLEKLPANNVDTGMGFERLVRVIQQKQSNYDTDLFTPLIAEIEKLSGKKYTFNDSKSDIAMRVISDHIRAISFSIADGQIPSNTGAGYVIRRILRRAIRYGYTYLDLEQPFLYKLVPVLSSIFKEVFGELISQKNYIEKVIHEEEESFFRTLKEGEKRFEAKAETIKNGVFSGKDAFELLDTYGFPIDLTVLMAKEKGLTVDLTEFDKELEIQKTRSRHATKIETDDWVIVEEDNHNSKFVGYNQSIAHTHILRYRKVKQGKNDFYQVILADTPFYAESGGQVGDTGVIENDKGEIMHVVNTLKEGETIIHFTKEIFQKTEGKVIAKIDIEKRRNTAKNHSATHLLHAALKEILGPHVEQKGSLVNDKILRFDFSHFGKMTDEEIDKVEKIVNQKIEEEIGAIIEDNIPLAEAKKRGVTALFGEKYGEKVRVVTFDREFSQELCGGTHVANTIELACFKIMTESSIASGVRRIEATTSHNALAEYKKAENTLKDISEMMKHPQDLPKSIEKLQATQSTQKKEIEKYEAMLSHLMSEQINNEFSNEKLIFKDLKLIDTNLLKAITQEVKKANSDSIVTLTSITNDKRSYIVAVGEAKLKSGTTAQQLVNELKPIIKGGGGGQPDLATAVGNADVDITQVKSFLEQKV